MGKKSVIVVVCALLIVLSMGALPAAAAEGPDRYTATTADGVKLAMKRYRPTTTARFRKGAQPILMMPALATSINEFDIRTPAGETYNCKLPSTLASWAKGDPYIQKDHLRYYSLAHYLWLQGYDVWMANYRGEGREPYLSGGANGYTIDDIGIYDAPAVVKKVFALTGKHPIWLGHSMGGMTAYIYLQGIRYGWGLNPRVYSDPVLVKKRNNGNSAESVKAFVDIDGPMVPFNGAALDNIIMWGAMAWPMYLDLRPFFIHNAIFFTDLTLFAQDILWHLCQMLGVQDLGPLNSLFSMNKDNYAPAVAKMGTKYCFDGLSTRVLAQFSDAAAHGLFREDFTNGQWRLWPLDPYPGDGLYVYSNNLKKIKLPSLVLADDRADITNPDDIKDFYLKKTRHPLDKFIRVPGAAHVDIICGLNTSKFTFPAIGKWLKEVCK
jgi:pimeloyl-ACP methyl ester carboxylesterase